MASNENSPVPEDPKRQELLDMLNTPGLTEPFVTYVRTFMDATAKSRVLHASPFAIPGLLQTAEYADQIAPVFGHESVLPQASLYANIRNRLGTLLIGSRALLHFVVSREAIGDTEQLLGKDREAILAAQIDHLQAVAQENPNVTVRVASPALELDQTMIFYPDGLSPASAFQDDPGTRHGLKIVADKDLWAINDKTSLAWLASLSENSSRAYIQDVRASLA